MLDKVHVSPGKFKPDGDSFWLFPRLKRPEDRKLPFREFDRQTPPGHICQAAAPGIFNDFRRMGLVSSEGVCRRTSTFVISRVEALSPIGFALPEGLDAFVSEDRLQPNVKAPMGWVPGKAFIME